MPHVKVPIVVIKTERNALSNRFIPYPEIKTNCVLALDDDIDYITIDEIEFGFQMWRSMPDRLIGWPSRVHYKKDGKLKYDGSWSNDASLGFDI